MDWEHLLQAVGAGLHTAAIYEANGAFVTVYWMVQHLVHILSLLGLVGMGMLDLTEHARLNPTLQPRRPGVTGPVHYTLWTATLWLVTAFVMPAPVPALGLVMLLVTLAVACFERPHRYQHLRRGKGALVLYSAAALGLRVYLALSADVYGWAATFGSVEAATQTLQQGRGLVQTIAMLALLYGIPVGYLALVVQEWISRPHSLLTPHQTAQEIVRDLHTRGGLSE
jgi:hypothetical protein